MMYDYVYNWTERGIGRQVSFTWVFRGFLGVDMDGNDRQMIGLCGRLSLLLLSLYLYFRRSSADSISAHLSAQLP